MLLSGDGEIDYDLLKSSSEHTSDTFTQFWFQTIKDLRSIREDWMKNLEK